MNFEEVKKLQDEVTKADAIASAARLARDIKIFELITSRQCTAYGLAKAIGITEGAIRQIVIASK